MKAVGGRLYLAGSLFWENVADNVYGAVVFRRVFV